MSVGCKCRPISVEQNLKIKENVVVSECRPTVRYRVVANQILRNNFFSLHLSSGRGGCFNTQNTR